MKLKKIKNNIKIIYAKLNINYRYHNYILNLNKQIFEKNLQLESRLSEINSKLEYIQNDKRLSKINSKLEYIQNDKRLSEINSKLEYIQNDKRLSEINSKLEYIQNDKSIISELAKIEEEIYSQKINIIFQKKTEKEKVLILGYYGAPNMGDELMLSSVINQIKSKNKEIYVLFEDNQKYNFSQWDDINFLEYPKTQKNIIQIAEYFDTLIIGGGAHLDDTFYDDKTAFSWHIPEMMMLLSKLFINKKKKTYFLSLSSNTKIKNKKFIEDLKEIINKSTYFSVRDKFSMEELINNGIDSKKIKLLNDPVFLVDIDDK